MYPNSVLSVWQLVIMAVIPVALLFTWLIAIYVASRKPARHDLAAARSPEESATAARTGSRWPEQAPTDRMAA
jgi:hypothetical protein